MYLKIKNSRLLRGVSVFSALSLMFQIFYPTAAYALTSGPSQPEIQSFEPISTNQMVNLFSGDFTYNIPLLTVPGPNGGYPINMSYHSGITMDQEASWVGLGWNINPGVINRGVNGLPDDFNGAQIEKEYYIKPVSQYTLSYSNNSPALTPAGVAAAGATMAGMPIPSPDAEVIGFDLFKGQVGTQLYYNTRTGVGIGFSMTPLMLSGSVGKYSGAAGLSLDYDSQSGMGLNVITSFNTNYKKFNSQFTETYRYTQHGLVSSRSSFQASMSNMQTGRNSLSGLKATGASTYHFNNRPFIPGSSFPTHTTTNSFFLNLGMMKNGFTDQNEFRFTIADTELGDESKTFDAYGFMYAENSDDASILDFHREKDGALPYSTKNLPVPSFTSDVYQVLGQGIGGAFKAHRSDVGILHDPKIENSGISSGNDYGLEYGFPVEVSDPSGVPAAPDLGPDFGLEFSVGADYSMTEGYGHTGIWSPLNENETGTEVFREKYKFLKTDDIQVNATKGYKDATLHEPFYMKSTGDITASDEDEANYLTNESAFAFGLGNASSSTILDDILGNFGLGNSSENNAEITGNILDSRRKKRERRSQNMVFKTIGDLSLEKEYKYDLLQHHNVLNYNELSDKFPGSELKDQVAEITVHNNSGMRYVYGLPAYNIEQKEVAFSVNHPYDIAAEDNLDENLNLFDYTPTKHVKTANGQGIDEFYSKNKTPAYAYTYFITASYSEDYVDITGDGPTEDDLGYYVKFDYDKVTDDYKWRAPFYDADHSEGAVSSYADNKAVYTYGKKEIYVLKSVETKTHIALFRTSSRNDAYGVTGEHQENPLLGNEALIGQKKLDRIDLYSKNESAYDPNSATQSIDPVKSVHLKYDYTLCEGIDNRINNTASTGTGKLTLKQLFFSSGKSRRAALSPYRFEYSDINPNYALNQVNRWGYYQPGINAENRRSPYVKQNSTYDNERHLNASAWNISKIHLPSGGEMDIEYEQDDYAFVQDKRAMECMKILGVGDETGINANGILEDNLYIYYAMNKDPELLTESESAANLLGNQMSAHHVLGVDELYFKAFMHLKNTPVGWEIPADGAAEDYVEGYATVDHTVGTTGYTRMDVDGIDTAVGYFKVNSVPISGDNSHPFQKAAIQEIKFKRPDLLTAPEDGGGSFFDFEEIIDVFFFFDDLQALIQGYYAYAKSSGYGSTILIGDNYPSFVRLNTEDFIKHGGGHRVKKITLNDNWGTMTKNDEPSFAYGQEYQYQLPDGKSSGVASYEPALGNEENPFHQPIREWTHDFVLKDDAMYNDAPLGESYYPMAQVGYSRVTVSNLVRDEEYNDSNERLTTLSGAGKLVHEFYTAKDFPVRIIKTPIKNFNKKSDVKIPLIGAVSYDKRAYSQGYAIHLNDMHGQVKSVSTYPETAKLFQKDIENPLDIYVEPPYTSKQSYHYDLTSIYDPNGVNRLDNQLNLIFPNGEKKSGYLGRTIDFFTETREDYNYSETIGGQGDFGVFVPPFVPTPLSVPMPFVNFNLILESRKDLFRSVTTNKIIAKNGILTKTVSNVDGVETIVENQLFDSETGQAVLSRVKNEFGSSIYQRNYPAHLAYEGMSGAYKNINAEYKTSLYNIGTNGQLDIYFDVETSGDVFFEGDELKVTTPANGVLTYWVKEITTETIGGTLYHKAVTTNALEQGSFSSPSGSEIEVKTIHSGYRNLLAANMGSKVYMEGAHKLTELIQDANNFIGIITAVDPQDSKFISQLLRDCDDEVIYGILNMYVENGNTFSFDFTVAEEVTPKAYIILPEDIDLLTAPYNDLSNYSFIKEEEVMHVQIADGTNDPIYVQAKWDDPEEVFLSCENVLQAGAITYDDSNWNIPYEELYDFDVNNNPANPMPISNTDINPYRYGKEGVWRAKESYTYLTKRHQTELNGDAFMSDLAKDGYYEEFTDYDWTKKKQDDINWRKVNEITRYSPYGFELENKNALNQYSSALYGYDGALSTAVAQNAKYNDLAYTGFEDVDENAFSTLDGLDPANGESVKTGHFLLINSNSTIKITDAEAHTGEKSIRIIPKPCDSPDNGNGLYMFFTPGELNSGVLNADYDKDYFLSAWVKTKHEENASVADTEVATIDVQRYEGSSWVTKSSGNSYWIESDYIDGWKKLDLKFRLEEFAGAEAPYRIRFGGGSCTGSYIYLDDIRIYPADGAMVSYVYDPETLWLKAELDVNNYATYYNYDDAGNLIQLKKETVEGIKTVTTNRTNTYKRLLNNE